MRIEDFLILGQCESKSEARRLVKAGAISINKRKVEKETTHIVLWEEPNNHILQYRLFDFDVTEWYNENINN
jgi:predicted rRNA methylase YqxC with S4 and FtsJ domains